ncbi:hypothetical protein COHA_010180 [Chlorella ohadii]|uniref:Mg-protoporphyrin IX chelatase n=1 Tax=Chlorella ohadii TaxID=2649997 RepID=A0AAD5DE91_9CHLO|nr:hypothetical protein COHA_010180 [Chlorella ohadii]
MASMLSSHEAAGGGSSWGSRDEAGGGGGTLQGSMEASWEYSGPRSFPMLSVVRLEHIKHALLLGAVDTGIGGIVIAGGHGVAKSVLARSLIDLLPPIEVAAASWCNADPDRPEEWEDGLAERLGGAAPARAVRPAPFVTVPLGVTEDRLLGTVDVEASMREGRPVFMPGLLAQCHRGVLYVDDINLLDEGICSLLLSAVAAGRNTVEREGISVSHPCTPLLIATYNPEEGELREGVLDRFAIGLSADIEYGVEARVQAVLAAERFQDSRPEVLSETEWGTEQLKLAVLAARETLPDVQIAEKHVRFLVEQAARLGCQGQRAEVFAARVARAAAALRGSDRVEGPDLQTAVQLAILPRATLSEPQVVQQQRPPPPPPPRSSKEQQEEEDRENQDQRDQQQQPPDEQQASGGLTVSSKQTVLTASSTLQVEAPAEFMVGVQDVALDPGVLFFALQQKRLRGRSGRSRNVVFSQDRGRYVKPMIPKGKVRRLAVDATLRAAAPYQLSRRRRAAASGKPARKIYIDQDDLRSKRLARKSRCLVLFVVDASGSMALNRMAAAKGAALRLLGQSYVSRDYVAVLPFHGDQAEVLVPPSRAIALAKRRLEVLPCGGGTPLAHALSLACRMGTNAQQKGEVGRCLVVLITDGRANGVLNQEVLDMAKRLGASGLKLLVIDTESRYISRGFAKEIATAAGGRYHRLPNAIDAVAAIAAAAGTAVAEAGR